MRDVLPWTVPMDARLYRLRCEGESWTTVAADLRLSAQAVRARARRLGLPDWCPADFRTVDVVPEDPHRASLPIGHERAWRVLTDGTLLEGTSCTSATDSGF